MAAITSETQAYNELVAGEVKEFYCLVDAAATVAIGQVFEWDATGANFINYTSGSAGNAYAVCAEAKTITVDSRIRCIVSGYVNKNKLDATAQADAEIEAALLSCGIIPLTSVSS